MGEHSSLNPSCYCYTAALPLVAIGMIISTRLMLCGSCPDGWLSYRNKCLYMKSSLMDQTSAREACSKVGASLAMVRSKKESLFILAFLSTASCRDRHPDVSQCIAWRKAGQCRDHTSSSWWMTFNCQSSCGLCATGCVDKYEQKACLSWSKVKGECSKSPWMRDKCALSCGCKKNESRGFWLKAESKLLPDELKKNSKCTRMDHQTGNWFRTPCRDFASGFVCEKAGVESAKFNQAINRIGCTKDTDGFGSSCYTTHVKLMADWDLAKSYCGGRLTVISDELTWAFVVSLLGEKKPYYWIGLRSDPKGRYKWIGDSYLKHERWAGLQLKGQSDQCVAMASISAKGEKLGSWRDFRCKDRKPFICMTKRKTPNQGVVCPPRWAPFKASCHKAFLEKVKWIHARDRCREYGGELASIHDAHSMVFFDRMMNGNDTWTGLHYSSTEKRYTWTDGSSLKMSECPLCAWSAGQPDKTGQCVRMKNRRWSVEECDTMRPYICSSKNPRCEDGGWEAYGGYCYMFVSRRWSDFQSPTFFWRAANEKCIMKGAQLVSIWDRGERDFLLKHMKQGYIYWVGLTSWSLRSNKWTDGSPKLEKEAINPHGRGICFFIYNATGGKLHLANCALRTLHMGFICKRLEANSGNDGTGMPNLPVLSAITLNSATSAISLLRIDCLSLSALIQILGWMCGC